MKRVLALTSLLAIAACAPMPPPPPPPPPPIYGQVQPPQAIPNTYIVFFDWNRSWISPAGMEVIRQAAEAWHRFGNVRVHVTGYTDTSGSYRYNVRLSERRAAHVAIELERFGVPRAAMEIRGLGETNLRVPTPHGVREPQNRRVEIIEG